MKHLKAKQPLVISYLRFSTREQAKGDSTRRQLAASAQWAKDNHLTIDRQLRDPGISAFKGANVQDKAQLGRLLELAKNGKIPKGSILLVENLDRLSRQDILPAQRMFLDLLENGIKVVTLADKKEYDAASVTANPMDLMYSIMVLSRGNEESKIKSERVIKAWRNRQENASADKPVTSICPQWLERKNKKWEMNPDAAKAIRHAAKMVINGFTWKAIIKKLNAKHPKTFGRKRIWTFGNLSSLMRKRTLIGEYQPAKRNGNSTPEKIGDAVADYYPAVLDDKTFGQVQQVIKGRSNGGGWRDCEVVNIWGGKMYDFAGNKMNIGDHGSGARYKSSGRKDGTSDMPMTPRAEVDKGLVLALLRHLEISEVQPTFEPAPLHRELGQIEARIDQLTTALSDLQTDPMPIVKAIERLQSQKNDLTRRILQAESPPDNEGITSVLRLADIEKPDVRRQLQVAIAQVVANLKVHFVRHYRDHEVAAVFYLVDGQKVECAFRMHYIKSGKYQLITTVPHDIRKIAARAGMSIGGRKLKSVAEAFAVKKSFATGYRQSQSV